MCGWSGGMWCSVLEWQSWRVPAAAVGKGTRGFLRPASCCDLVERFVQDIRKKIVVHVGRSGLASGSAVGTEVVLRLIEGL